MIEFYKLNFKKGVFLMRRSVNLLLITFLFLVSVSIQAAPVTLSFTQGGFSEGAILTMSFSGEDLNNDTEISSFQGEVTGFALNFSGNSIVPAFNLGFADLFGLVYDLDGGPLGDGQVLDIEGVGAQNLTYQYFAGPGPVEVCGIGLDCAFVSDGINQDFSQELLVLVEPPRIPTLSQWSLLILMMVIGLFGLRMLQGRIKL